MFTRAAARIAIPAPIQLLLLAAALVLMPISAGAQYKLQSGDTLEISLAGVPDFKQRSPIRLGGTIYGDVVDVALQPKREAEALTPSPPSLSPSSFSSGRR